MHFLGLNPLNKQINVLILDLKFLRPGKGDFYYVILWKELPALKIYIPYVGFENLHPKF